MKILHRLRREYLQLLLLALPFAAAAAWWRKIPATVATHWDIHSRPDGWMPKAPGLLLLPVLNIVVCLLIAFLPGIDSGLRRATHGHSARQQSLRRIFRHALSGFLTLLALTMTAVAAGCRVDVGRVCCNGALILLAVTGNFLGRLEPNYLMGVRTPWTLADGATWRATHRWAARAMVFGALALLGAGLFLPPTIQIILLLVYVVSLAAWSWGYSAWFFQRRRTA